MLYIRARWLKSLTPSDAMGEVLVEVVPSYQIAASALSSFPTISQGTGTNCWYVNKWWFGPALPPAPTGPTVTRNLQAGRSRMAPPARGCKVADMTT